MINSNIIFMIVIPLLPLSEYIYSSKANAIPCYMEDEGKDPTSVAEHLLRVQNSPKTQVSKPVEFISR